MRKQVMCRVATWLTTIGALLCWHSLAQAAVVSHVQGSVKANVGAGFKQVVGSAKLSKGAVLTVGPRSGATVHYENGCSYRVGENRTIHIGDENRPCKTASLKDGAVEHPGPRSGPISSNTALLIGGAAVVGGIIYVVSLSP